MTAREAIERARVFRPNAAKDEVMLSWLSELEGRVHVEIFLLDVHDTAPIFDMDTELYAKYPHDAIYEAYLIMQTDLYHKEYDAFSASRMRFDELWGVFARYMATYHRPADEAKARGRGMGCGHGAMYPCGTVQPFWTSQEAYIGVNGNWWYGGLDTGIRGVGISPHIGENGNWWIGKEDTGVKAQVPTMDFEETDDGVRIVFDDGEGIETAVIKNGITPRIGQNGNWWIGTADTGKKAVGKDGYTPQKGVDYFTQKDKEEIALLVTRAATPQMYGAKGDGVTNDTAAIQTCFDENETIYFPKGTYMVDGTITLHSNMHIVLDDNAIIRKITKEETGVDLFQAVECENIKIEGGKIYGDLLSHTLPEVETGLKCPGIRFRACKNIVVENVEIAYHMGDSIVLCAKIIESGLYIPAVRSENVVIKNCVIHDSYRHGIVVSGVDSLSIEDTKIYGIKYLDDVDFECDKGDYNVEYHDTYYNSNVEIRRCNFWSENSGLSYRRYYGVVNNDCDGLVIEDSKLGALNPHHGTHTKVHRSEIDSVHVSINASCDLDDCVIRKLVPASSSAVTNVRNCLFKSDDDEQTVYIAVIQEENIDGVLAQTAELHFHGCTFISSTRTESEVGETSPDMFLVGASAVKYTLDHCKFIIRNGFPVRPMAVAETRVANCEIHLLNNDVVTSHPIALGGGECERFEAVNNVIYAYDLDENYGNARNVIALNAKTVHFANNVLLTSSAIGKNDAALKLGESVETAYVFDNITPEYPNAYVLANPNTVVKTNTIDQTYDAESENAQSGKAVAEALAGKVGLDAWEQIGSVTLAEDVTSHRFFRGNMMRRVKIFATVPEGGSGEFYYEITCITASGTAKSNLYGRLDCTQSYAELYLEDGKLIAHAYFLDADGRTQLCSHIAPIDAIYIRDLTLRNSGTGLTGATFEVRGVIA